MASSITIDTGDLGQQLIAEVKTGIAKLQGEVVKAVATKEESGEKVDISGSREQVLGKYDRPRGETIRGARADTV